ncbi:hypothetical protein H7Y29_03110 [Microbacteriaceae bacterium]|nr:hypothetical protein [Candidatus Saccharibacteria bacterium]
MTSAEQFGLKELQNRYPNSRVAIDAYGVAVISPLEEKSRPQLPEVKRALHDLRAGIGQATLLKLEVEE